jgi:hypothetical protein
MLESLATSAGSHSNKRRSNGERFATGPSGYVSILTDLLLNLSRFLFLCSC